MIRSGQVLASEPALGPEEDVPVAVPAVRSPAVALPPASSADKLAANPPAEPLIASVLEGSRVLSVLPPSDVQAAHSSAPESSTWPDLIIAL